MRLRHTSRTDPEMEGDRSQVSFRLNSYYRDRLKDVVDSRQLPDIRTAADVMQDAMWLWFHEYDLMVEKGLIPDVTRAAATREARDRVGASTAGNQPSQETVAVGETA